MDVLPTQSQHPHPHQPNASLPRLDDDVYNNTLSAPEQHIKAHTPPPAYASLSPRPGSPILPPPPASGCSSLPPSSEHSSASSSSSQQTWPNGYPYTYSDTRYLPTSTSHTHPEFGPTPLTSGHPLLAVPHAYIGAPGAADRRARWRFVGSMFCAVVLLMGVSGLVGLGLLGEWGGGPGPRPSRGRICWGIGAGC